MRLRTRLYLLVAGTVVPLVGLALALGALLVDHERETFQRLASDRARSMLSAVDALLEGHVTTLLALSSLQSLGENDLRSFHRDVTRVLKSQPAWENVILSDPSGREILHGLREFGEPLPQDPDPESLARAFEKRRPVVGSVARWESTGRRGIAIRVPLAGGQPRVLSAVIALDQFERLLQAQNVPPQWVMSIVDRNSRFVGRVPRPRSEFASESFRSAIARAPEGWFRGKTIEGADTFTAHLTSRASGWSLGLAVPADLVHASAARFGWGLALGTLAMLAAALAIAWWMSRRITLPIAALAASARQLGREGRVDADGAARGIDELRDVQQALDSADSAMREREALQQREQVALKAADRSKDEFLAMLGHELRNPLSAITTSSHVLRSAPAGGRMHSQALVIIERQARQMARLVDDLLDVSRLTMGKVELRPEPFDLALLARQLVQTWEASGRVERGRIVITDSPAWVLADRARIEQVIANLLDNANRYTPSGKHIDLGVAREGASSVLQVTDEGPGIAPEMLANVFKAFVQAPQGPDRREGGLGLGLAVVQRLAELHGGSVEAANVEGKGARFTVKLPATDELKPDREDSKPVSVQRSLRVLVVEDGEDAREMLHALLALQGHEVRTAGTGAEALEAAREFCPEVVLLDIGLPDIDGYEVARRMRGTGSTRDARIVALTGYGQSDDERRAHDSGFDLHITKPVEPQSLARVLSELSATATTR